MNNLAADRKHFLEEFKTAIKDEIAFIERNGFSSILIRNGRCIQKNKSDFWYEFDVEYLLNLPEDTPCNLVIEESTYQVLVVSYKESTLIISSGSMLSENLNRARLDSGATVLFERLLQRIKENESKENNLGSYLYPQYDKEHINQIMNQIDLPKLLVPDISNKLNQEQKLAVESALNYPITFIWGPPGTGKTHVIGEIINSMIQMDKTVLLVSHTNTAVDGAIEKANKRYSETSGHEREKHPILRLGNDNLSKEAELCTLANHRKKEAQELTIEKLKCESEMKKLQQQIDELTVCLNKYEWIKNSRVLELKDISQKIDELNRNRSLLIMKLKQIEDELESYKIRYPNFRTFDILENKLQHVELNQKELMQRIDWLKKFLVETPYRIQSIEIELQQYQQLKELNRIEGKQFSIENQKNRIETSKKVLEEVRNDINNLEKSKQVFDDKIIEAENKNFAYVFFRKKDTEALKNEASKLNEKIIERKEEFRVFELAYIEAKTQLAKSIINHRAMASFKFTDSEQDLVDKSQLLKQQIISAEKELAQLLMELNSIEVQQSSLLEEYSKVKPILELFKKVWSERDSCRDREKAISDEITKYRGISQSIFQAEKEYYKKNVANNENDLSLTPEVLESKYYEVQHEISRYNLEEMTHKIRILHQSLSQLLSRLNQIETLFSGIDRKIILESQVIGTTLVQSYLSDILNERIFDMLIIDEASMASNPTIWTACYLANKSVVIVGDSRQLSPIVMATSEVATMWMGKDIFIHSDLDKFKCFVHPNTVALKQQYRMEKEIEAVANLYYDGRLMSAGKNAFRANERNRFDEWYPKELGERDINVIDTSKLHAWATGVPRGKSSSRLNIFSATLCVELAFLLLEKKIESYLDSDDPKELKPEILIVAPYKPHVQKIEELISYECKRRRIEKNFPLISVGTIHKFQGNEASIVIFDLVVDEPHWRANLFMEDDDMKQQEKLFTVAVTRAKFKLFVVGNIPYLTKRTKNNALGRLLNELKPYKPVDAHMIFPDIRYAKKVVGVEDEYENKGILCNENTFYDYFLRDVQKASKCIIIFSPFMSQFRLGILLPYFSDKISEGVSITIITKSMGDRKKSEVQAYKQYVEKLRVIGVTIIYKKDMHEKTALIDNDRVWNGSLNILSHNNMTGEIMIRFLSEGLMKSHRELLSVDSLTSATVNKEELKCPNCGEDMMLAEGRRGGHYWTCINGDYSRQTSQKYAYDGVIKCHCGSPFSYSMKDQPRWVCTSNRRHFRKIQKGDLMVENMMKLIPKSEHKRLFKYFGIEPIIKKKEKTVEQKPDTVQMTLFDN